MEGGGRYGGGYRVGIERSNLGERTQTGMEVKYDSHSRSR